MSTTAKQIVSIQSPSFQGRPINLQLGAVNLIQAGNFEGKTSVLNAIRAGVFGYVAEIGKMPAALGLALGETDLKLTFSTGEYNHFQLSLANDNIWKKEVHVSVDFPELLVDINEYLGAKERERMRMLFNAADLNKAGWKQDDFLCNCLHTAEKSGSISVLDTFREIKAVLNRLESLHDLPETLSSISDLLHSRLKASLEKAKYESAKIQSLRPVMPLRDYTKELEQAKEQLRLAQGMYAEANSQNNSWETTQNAITNFEQQVKYGKSYDRDLKKLRARLLKLNRQPHDFVPGNLDQAQSEMCALEAECESIQAAMLKPICRCPLCDSDGVAVRNRLKERARMAKGAFLAAGRHKDAETGKKRVLDELSALNGQILGLEDQKADADEAKGKLKELGSKKTKSPEAYLKKWEKEVEQKQSIVDGLNSKQDEYRAMQVNQQTRNAAEQTLLSAQRDVESYKKISKVVDSFIGKLASNSIKSLLDVANQFTTGILRSPLDFYQGKLGRRVSAEDIEHKCHFKRGAWIPHEVFSGTEKKVAYLGFSVALCQSSEFKLVMFDEFGTVEPILQPKILNRLVKLQRNGIINQAVLVTSDIKYAPPKGVTLIKL